MRKSSQIRRGYLGAAAAVVLAAISTPVAFAGGGSGSAGPAAKESAVSGKKFKKLKKQVADLQAQVDALARQPGPQGPPGTPGTAPACRGNGSGDTMVSAGSVCIDKYEVSVWSSPTGGTQYGAGSDDYPAACTDTGQNCKAGTAGEIYARSVPGPPSRFITYFQAQQALANSGKRLPTNAEWQQAVAGTPDPGTDNGTTDCNVGSTFAVANTGSRSSCVSNHDANDMVGNLHEWVADWDEQASGCANWPVDFGTDLTCLGSAAGEASTRLPGALFRGGSHSNGIGAGLFAVLGDFRPSNSQSFLGFRGAR